MYRAWLLNQKQSGAGGGDLFVKPSQALRALLAKVMPRKLDGNVSLLKDEA